MSDEIVQLDLTLSVTEVPQANNLALFVRLVDAVHRGTDEVSALADELNQTVRLQQQLHARRRLLPSSPSPAARARAAAAAGGPSG